MPRAAKLAVACSFSLVILRPISAPGNDFIDARVACYLTFDCGVVAVVR